MTTPFLETPRFPDDLAFWARGGVNYNTVVSGSTSGRETRNALWQYGRGLWQLQNAFRTNNPSDSYNVMALRNYFRVAKGQAYGFRMRDWTDYLDEGNGVLGAPLAGQVTPVVPSGVGLGLPVYQLYKLYNMSPLVDVRAVQKPLAGTVSVLKNGATFAGTLDYTTGLFTVTESPTTATIASVAVGATTAITFSGAAPTGLVTGNYLYVDTSGATGALGGFLGGQSWLVTGIAGLVVTVAANTTGLTTGAVTTGKRFPTQAGDAVTWTGSFDTPVRFDQDNFDVYQDGSGLWVVNLNLVEVRL